MAREEQLVASSEETELPPTLYDYLYRDTNRLASYSAQMFGSVTQSIEDSNSTRRSKDRRAQIGPTTLAVLENKGTEELTEGQKLLSQAHDVVTNDVLSRLMSENRLVRDVVEAPHGSLVMASGTIVFMDRSLIRTAALVTTESLSS